MDDKNPGDPPPTNADRETALRDCEAALGYNFRQLGLLRQALTHPSSTADKRRDNERLEFFGDAIISFIVCEYLYTHAAEKDEGVLTEIKAAVVSRAVLAQVAQRLELYRYLILGHGLGPRQKLPLSIYANALEAVVAAIYLDGGIEAARDFTMRHLREAIMSAAEDVGGGNHKAALQDWLQKRGLPPPRYEVVETKGPAHRTVFTVSACIEGVARGRGMGMSKKEAEQAAAQEALQALAQAEKSALDKRA